MNPLFFNLESDQQLFQQLVSLCSGETGELEQRDFPDGESYLRVVTSCQGRNCVILCNLYQPNSRILPLIFLADTLRELGAAKIILVSPYLAYMRQDKRFKDGECVTSRPFASLLSSHIDHLITVDPHLHRYQSLDEIYSISSTVVPAAPLIANWIKQEITNPVLIGPDEESEQWVAEVARLADAPMQVLTKERRGDYDVSVSMPDLNGSSKQTPVLIDDIISSGRTMIETLAQLRALNMTKAYCIGVHGIFAGESWYELQAQAELVTSNTIPHPTNQINIAEALAVALKQQWN